MQPVTRTFTKFEVSMTFRSGIDPKWMDRSTNGRTDGRTDGLMVPFRYITAVYGGSHNHVSFSGITVV